jgi:tetrapyrrole methylase family protein/MazG family protein/ATP diphosphatase
VPARRTKQARVDARARRAAAALARLVRIMDTLRSPGGCPWDREQTHASLRPFLLEETYEALEALDREDFDVLPGELGDVLFQCVFHAQIAAEAGRFDLADAIDAICAKLIRRHPHVFTPAGRRSAGRAPTSRAVVEQWEQLKAREQDAAGRPRRVLAGIPRAMPALLRAYEIGARVGAVGFDWTNPADVVDKIDEEVRELRAALAESPARAAEELGDLLFSIANLARKLKLEPESALRAANDKFTRRFDALENRLERSGRRVHESSPDELERAWAAIKGPTAAATSRRVRRPSGSRPRGRRSRR